MGRTDWYRIGADLNKIMDTVRTLSIACFWFKKNPAEHFDYYMPQLKRQIEELEDDIRQIRSGDGRSGETDQSGTARG